VATVATYAIWYLNEYDEWTQYQTFPADKALAAEDAYQALRRLGPRRRYRLVRQVVLVLADSEEEV
jgi:hypothetical protein